MIEAPATEEELPEEESVEGEEPAEEEEKEPEAEKPKIKSTQLQIGAKREPNVKKTGSDEMKKLMAFSFQ